MVKMRSPNYPAVGLSQAIQYVRALWDKEKRTQVSAEIAAKALGYKTLNGPARSALSALRKYGLVDSGKGGVRVSDLVMTILHDPPTSEERQRAIREAASKPGIFREMYATYAEASDDALRSHLLKKGFSEWGAGQFIAAFRDTLALANLPEPGYIQDKDSKKDISGGDTMETTSGMQAALIGGQTGKPVLRVFCWPLGKDISAEVRITTAGDIKSSHLERLRQYLDLAKEAIEAEPE